MDNQNGKQIEHTDSNNHLNTDNNHSVKEDCERHSPKMAKMAETNNPNAIVMDKKNKSVHSTKHISNSIQVDPKVSYVMATNNITNNFNFNIGRHLTPTESFNCPTRQICMTTVRENIQPNLLSYNLNTCPGGLSIEQENVTNTSKTNAMSNQSRIVIGLNRLYFSRNYLVFYILMVILCLLTCAYSVVELVLTSVFLNTVVIFILDIAISFIIAFDFTAKLIVARKEYLESNNNTFLLIMDPFVIAFSFVRITFYLLEYSVISISISLTLRLFQMIRFVLAYRMLKRSLTMHENIMKNVEEIINFTKLKEDVKVDEPPSILRGRRTFRDNMD